MKGPLLTIFLVGISLLVVATCNANIITVGNNAPALFETIQEAISHAKDGDIVEVVCDVWNEQNVKKIDLMGKDIIVRSDCPENTGYLSATGFISNKKQATGKSQLTYVPRQMIVKFRKRAADLLEAQLTEVEKTKKLPVSDSLNNLNKKHKLKKIRPLFRDFKQKRQDLESLHKKKPSHLTKKEKHLLKRQKRADTNLKPPDLDRIYILEFGQMDDQQLQEVLGEYKREPDVEYAELNYTVSINLTPNDSLYSIQWPLHNTGQMYPESGNYNHPPGTPDCDIDAPQAWDINTGSSQVIVAVLDTGVDYNHRDLDQNMWVNSGETAGNGIDDDENGYEDDIYGYDFINDDGNPIDDHGHGTHCSGTIAADSNNIFDITGVCWDTKIMALKFLGSDGVGTISDAVSAYYYAVDNGADVMSNSWGGGGFSQTEQQAIDYAYSQGVIILASAGNDDNNALHYPAAYEHVISVAATNSNDQRAPFSNYGDWIDVAAPGVDVLSLRAAGTSIGTTYDAYTTIASGTSMSCPHAAGVTALIISQYPAANIEDITARLFGTTDNVSQQNPGYEYLLGYGRINAFNAVAHQPHPHIIFRECVVLDETTGNGNGFLEPGETAQLGITLKNIWVDATNVTAQLGSDDTYITILDDSSDYGDVARDQEQDNLGDLLEIALSEECPRNRRVVCYLTITADGGYTNIVYFPISTGFRVPEQFSTIQEAVDVSQDGDAITVADGTYTGDGNRDIDFKGKAITIQSENGPENCIIDCEGSANEPHRGFYLHSGEGPDSVIDGFTIINGYAPLNSEHFQLRAGGAISSDGDAEFPWPAYTNPTIKNCIIRGNRAADMGGGIFLRYGSAKIINCDVSYNYNGGIFIYDWGNNVTVTHCNVSNNVGIGIECELGNWMEYGSTISNCLISDNTAGGIYDSNHNLWISNCTIANNKGYAILSHLFDENKINIVNSIAWGNTLGAFHEGGGTYDVTYSDIQTGQSGQGNINIDPDFLFSDDYHLMVGSPCIDTGTNNPFDGPDSNDLDGNPRLQDGDGDGPSVVDMGAYEFAEWVPGVPYIYGTPWELIYNCNDDSPTQEDQTIYISNAGAGTLNWEVIEDCNWVEVIPTSGQSAGEVDEVTVRVDTTGQPPGHYTCTLQIFDELAAVSVQLVRVNLSVGPRRVPQQYSTIQAAIDAALEGNTVIISDGLYTGPGNRDINFWGKTITVKNANGPENCIIDCENLGKGFLFKNKEERDSILEGLTIINASPYVGFGPGADDIGVFSWAADFFSHSGIYCQYSSPTIKNCRILNCWSAGMFGGGIYCKKGSPKIINCLIEGNSSEVEGGGIFLHYDTPAVVENCTITNNSAPDGGGISVWTVGATFNNCLITGNSASNFGGGVYVESSTNFRNCTLADNTAVSGGGFYIEQDTPVIKNSILWGNWPDEVYLESGTATIRYSDIEGGWSDAGNINQNPNFAFSGDYHLMPGSPCIDAGNNSAVPGGTVTDLDGSDRFYDDPGTTDTGNGTAPIVDMGAYEYSQTPRIAVSPLELEFMAEEGGANPSSQILSVRNCGGEILKWEISKNCSWLKTDPNSGTSTGQIDEVTLSADISGLAVGRYDCELRVSDPNAVNSPRTVTVTLYILGDVSYVPGQFSTIQDAIDRVPPGNTIIVADGTYAGPGNRNIDFNGKAITLRSANGPDNCFICAWGESNRGFHFHSGEGADSVLEGFTIFGGSNEKGAGICCENSSPSIINCKVNRNQTFAEPTPENAKGGGIYCQNSYALISDCTLWENYSDGKGGGLYNLGGGPTLTNCIIDFNIALNFAMDNGSGGGIYNSGGDLTLLNCTISNNMSDFGDGGGIYNSAGTVTLTNCTIHSNNICIGIGDAIYSSSGDLTATNCLIWGNFTICDIGDTIYNSGSATLTNCTIVDNSENGIYSDGWELTLQNCIVRGHQNEIVGSASVTYSDVQGGFAGNGNIDADPCFVDTQNDNYHLRWGSPCMNAGDPGYSPAEDESDIDGEPRVWGGRVDMGADEVTPVPGDLQPDGNVDLDDVLIMALQWLDVPGIPSADIAPDEPDNFVDYLDFSVIGQNWQ